MSLFRASSNYANVQFRALKKATLRRYLSTKSCDPLRVLFCGSDELSIASLRALHKEHVDNPGAIESIDVVCRAGKRAGRGLKTIREVPIKSVAQQLGLRVHEIDTFTRWTSPNFQDEPINLIIAVSFGLFVPPRILTAAKYGGLNVHPSLLPDFRGPAPLHHTLLAGDSRTGITLQTLHAEKFDHGRILDQTRYPGIDIPNAKHCSVPQLLDFVAPLGAEMLIRGIRNRVFVPPLEESGWYREGMEGDRLANLRVARKITTEDRHINWRSWTGEDIIRRYRVLGPLWNTVRIGEEGSVQEKRVIFSKISRKARPHQGPFYGPGLPYAEIDLTRSLNGKAAFIGGLRVKTRNADIIEIGELKIEGENVEDASSAAAKAGFFSPVPMCIHGGEEKREFSAFQDVLH